MRIPIMIPYIVLPLIVYGEKLDKVAININENNTSAKNICCKKKARSPLNIVYIIKVPK